MTPAQRREARISFAMLPIGAVLVVAAVLGIVAVLALGAAAMLATQDAQLGLVCRLVRGRRSRSASRNLVRSLQDDVRARRRAGH